MRASLDRGRLVAEHVTVNATTDTSSYTYAEPGWLTDEVHTRGGAWSRSYDHDASGNRITQTDGATTETLTWDGSVVTAIDAAAPVLDPFDAVVDEDGLTFLHDPDGELAEVQDASGALRSILRDPEGRPLSQRDAAGDERLTFYGLSHGALPLEVVTEDGEVITEIVVEGVRLGQKRSGEAKPTPIVTDPRGAVLQLGGETLPAFGAFGENTQGPSGFDERHLFAGLESLPEAPGVMLAQHRAYHPRTGRFLSPDPLGLAGGMFRTRYAEGDGVNLVDPTGWTASGPSATDPEQMAESGDDGSGPLTGVHEGEEQGRAEFESLCSLSPSACSGNDASGFEKAVRGLLILGEADLDEPEAEIDAGGAAPEGDLARGGEALAEGGAGEGGAGEGGLLTRRAERRAERRAIGAGDGLDDDRSNRGPEAGVDVEREATISGVLERLNGFGGDLLNAARRDVQERRALLNDLKSATERQLGPVLRLLAEVGLDGVQAFLGVAGLVPFLGEWADGADLVISMLRGDVMGAALGAGSLLPIGGQGPGLVKVARKMEAFSNGLNAAGKLGDGAKATIDVAAGAKKKGAFAVTPNGVVLPPGVDYNLVPTKTGTRGDFLQIHQSHDHGGLGAASGLNAHTHVPKTHTAPNGASSIKRESYAATAGDIDRADSAIKGGTLRIRSGINDKGDLQ